MQQPGTISPVTHASIAGISGIVAALSDGEAWFYDWSAKERYRVADCPPLTLGNAVALEMVPQVLAQMRGAKIVQLP